MGWTSSARIGAALLACAGAGAARADCPAANQFVYSFTNAPAATLNYANSYSYTATSTSAGSRPFTVSFQTYNLSSAVVNGNIQLPAISTLVNGGGANTRNLAIGGILAGRTAAIGNNSRVIVTRFTFAQPIRDLTMQISDIDFSENQYRDWIQVTGSQGGTSYVPSLTTPYGTNNGASGPRMAAGSTVLLGPNSNGTLAASQGLGLSTNENQSNGGTITASFAEPVTVVELRYGNFPLQSGESQTGQQAFGIQRLSFCPMPILTAVKSSTPLVTTAGDPQRFNIPGADVVYTISVTNTGGSPAEIGGALLTDVLPPQTTFFNGDFDGAGPIVGPWEVTYTGGTNVTSGSVTFSNNNGATYAYTPAAGYDAAVDAIQMSGIGTIPAGGGITLRFRARIN